MGVSWLRIPSDHESSGEHLDPAAQEVYASVIQQAFEDPESVDLFHVDTVGETTTEGENGVIYTERPDKVDWLS